MLKKSLIAILLLIIFNASAAALTKDITIKADKIYRDKLGETVYARGNVVAKGKDFVITADYLKHHLKQKRVVSEGVFTLKQAGYRIFGQDLSFNYKTKKGVARMVRVNFKGVYLGGSHLRLDKEKVDIINAYFTACSQPESHYHVSATEMILYPKSNWIVTYWGVFWAGPIPTIPLPTFVYDTTPPAKEVTEKKGAAPAQNVAPFPEIGSNPVDGFFITQRLSWFATPSLFGRFSLGYAQNKGMGANLRTNYIFNEEHEGELRTGGNNGDGFFGGLTHAYSFGPKLTKLRDQYALGGEKFYDFLVNISWRERIHLEENIGPYDRVSFLPNLTLRANRKKLWVKNLTYFAAITTGQVTEESSGLSSPRTNLTGDITYQQPLGFLGNSELSIDANILDYGSLGRWSRATGNVLLNQRWGYNLGTGFGYMHYLLNRGVTPYNFEKYQFQPFDEFKSYVFLKFDPHYLGISLVHYLPSWDAKDIDYFITFGGHCYDLRFSWRAIRREFSFGVSLVPSRD